MTRYFWLKYDGKIVEEITREKYWKLQGSPQYKHKLVVISNDDWLGLIDFHWIRLDVLKQILEAHS